MPGSGFIRASCASGLCVVVADAHCVGPCGGFSEMVLRVLVSPCFVLPFANNQSVAD